MQKSPEFLKPVGVVLAILVAGILMGGIISVPYRAVQEPSGYSMPRVHLNTKNTTRFDGQTLEEVAALVSQAVYPATSEEFSPDVIFLYDPENWKAGLQAASLLRPLNGLLLPATENAAEEINRLRPSGSQSLGGAQVVLLEGVQAPPGVNGQKFGASQIAELSAGQSGNEKHAILVNPEDPGNALLAAPWAAYSGDLVLFDRGQAPAGIPIYALGDIQQEGVTTIGGADPAATAVAFASYESPDSPFFGWGMNAESLTGYRAYTLARADQPAMALLAANLNIRGKPGPLLWSEERALPTVVNNYVWSQRAAFYITPAEGPFHHFFVLGGEDLISFPAQGQADYAVEIGPYLGKGVGMSGIDLLAAAWLALGIASAVWILFHSAKFLPEQMWVMRLAWPLLAMMTGPFGILFYYLAYSRPVIRAKMRVWDRPLWLQGMVATASAVGFGATLMIVSGYLTTFFGAPLIPMRSDVFYLLGNPMILIMIINYVVAVIISWLVFQAPMLAMFYGKTYRQALSLALPLVLASMFMAALAMNPGMWWLMMVHIPMMPTEESILWFGVMFFTGFLAFLTAWPLNYFFIRSYQKSGMM